MSKPLLLVWDEKFVQGQAIVDEQHRGVLATINSLHYFLQEGNKLKHLLPTVKILMSYIVFHYKTEEGILRSMEYPKLDDYSKHVYEEIAEFKKIYDIAMKLDDPQSVLLFLKDWWTQHLAFHEEITPYLFEWQGKYMRIDRPEEKF